MKSIAYKYKYFFFFSIISISSLPTNLLLAIELQQDYTNQNAQDLAINLPKNPEKPTLTIENRFPAKMSPQETANYINCINQVTSNAINTLHDRENKKSEISPHEVMAALNASFKTWAYDHWLQLTFGGLITCYSLGVLGLRFAADCLEQHESWACWHHEIPIGNLRLLPLDAVAQELTEHITQFYPSSTPVIAIAHFLRVTDTEIAHIQRYIKLCNRLEYVQMLNIFPSQTASRLAAQEKLERLIFLQTVIAAWPDVLQSESIIVP